MKKKVEFRPCDMSEKAFKWYSGCDLDVTEDAGTYYYGGEKMGSLSDLIEAFETYQSEAEESEESENGNKITNFYDIVNADEIREELKKLIRKYTLSFNHYQTDIYLYVDEDRNGSLYEYDNIGGNSWLNDNHYLLHTIQESCDSIDSMYDSVADLAMACGKTVEELCNECGSDNEYDIRKYVSDKYADQLAEDLDTWIDDAIDYDSWTDGIIDRFNAKF